MYKAIFLLICFFNFNNAFALDSSTFVDKANLSYQSANYQDAIKFYSQALEQGLENGELYFNLGNSYYRNSEPAKAIYYYRKALNLLPSDPDIRANLDYVRKEIKDRIEIDSLKNIFFKIADSLILIKRVNTEHLKFYLLCVVFSCCLFQLITSFYKRAELKPIVWVLSIISLYFLILIIFTKPNINSEREFSAYLNKNYGVILIPEVNVYAGDSLNYQVIAVLHLGTELILQEERGDWIEILLPNNRKGWIEVKNIGIL